MTDIRSPLTNNLSLASKCAQAYSLLNSGLSFVFDDKFESAAGCFEALLILVETDPSKLNYNAEHLLSLKFALCCCYFYAGTEHERNLQILKEMQNFELPAVDYMSAAVLYKLNVPSLALKNIECGLYKLSNCTLTKLFFWPETDILINLSEKTYLKRQMEELREKIQSAASFIPCDSKFTSNRMILNSVNMSKLNATASEFYPGMQNSKPATSGTHDNVNAAVENELKDELHRHLELLQRIYSEQHGYTELKSQIESQRAFYEKKVKELEQKIDEKDKLIATLSIKDKLSQDTSDKMLNSIKSCITEKNNKEVEKIRNENMKLRDIIAKLTEKYFSVQFAVSKNNETHCLNALEHLNVLVKNLSVCPYLHSAEIEEETNIWKTKLENVVQHRKAAENTLMIMKNDTSGDTLKLLNDLAEGCSCIINKPDLLQRMYKRYIKKHAEDDINDSSSRHDYSASTESGTQSDKDWKHHLRKHRVTSLGLTSTNGQNTDKDLTNNTPGSGESIKSQIKKASNTTDNSSDEHDSWIDQEISKLSERVKLIGGQNYWRLIVFIKDKLPLESEDAIVDAVEMVRSAHGKLNGLSRDKIFSEAQNIIQLQKKQKKSLPHKAEKTLDSNKCSVCLEVYNSNISAVLTCGHRFHKSCIQAWLCKEPLCPVCRAFIVPQEYNTLKKML